MLEVSGLMGVRGERRLFRDLSFRLQPGELLHLAGTNGAGKTTLLRMLCGLTEPEAGQIRWQGQSIRELGEAFGEALTYVGHANGLSGELTVTENLAAEQQLRGGNAETLQHAMHALALEGLADLPAKSLSQGQKRRLALARLLIAPRPLWILDEPFTALDTQSSARLAEIVERHLDGGGLVALTSHQELRFTRATLVTVTLSRGS